MTSFDAGALAASTVVIVVVSMAAVAAPAIRAARVAPANALRAD